MDTIQMVKPGSAGDYALLTPNQAEIADSLSTSRGKSSKAAGAKETTPKVEPTASDLNIVLSILRANFAEAKNAGLPLRSGNVNGKIVIEIKGARECLKCQGWWIGSCPTCAGASSTEQEAA